LLDNQIDVVIYQDSYAPTEEIIIRLKNNHLIKRLIVVEHNTPDYFLTEFGYYWEDSLGTSIKRLLKRFIKPYYYHKSMMRTRRRHVELYTICDQYVLLSKRFIPVFKSITNLEEKDLNKLCCISNPLTILPPTSINYTEKENKCLFVGRLTKQKGIPFLLMIWKEIELNNFDWSLDIVGEGEMRPYIESFITENNLMRVRLIGADMDMTKYYKKAKILCMTSIYEGYGLVLTEAMAFGVVPIAFSSYKSIFDIIDNKVDGILIKPFNLNIYSSSLLEMMHDACDLNNMSTQGIVKSNQFRVDQILKSWSGLIRNL